MTEPENPLLEVMVKLQHDWLLYGRCVYRTTDTYPFVEYIPLDDFHKLRKGAKR